METTNKKAIDYSVIYGCRKDIRNKINKQMLDPFLKILELMEGLAFLDRLEAVGFCRLELKAITDFDLQYGEHSTGPFITLKASGKAKLYSLGLKDADIEYLLNMPTDVVFWLITRKNGCLKAERQIMYTREYYERELSRKKAAWAEHRENPRFKASCAFLTSMVKDMIPLEYFD